LLGKRLRVLVESAGRDGTSLPSGTSCRYAPVEIAGGGLRPGELVDVEATGVGDSMLQAAIALD